MGQFYFMYLLRQVLNKIVVKLKLNLLNICRQKDIWKFVPLFWLIFPLNTTLTKVSLLNYYH